MATCQLADLLDGAIVGLYFSNSWSCWQEWIPKLVQLQKAVRARGQKFEIIFVSSDSKAAGFKKSFDMMPWLALPFGDDRIGTLDAKFMKGKTWVAPRLVLLGPDGETLTDDGLTRLEHDPEGELFPWRQPMSAERCEHLCATHGPTAFLIFIMLFLARKHWLSEQFVKKASKERNSKTNPKKASSF
eukprot:TRINITY_DN3964_c0_g1_i1.p2 TRINITY_DN3964_c0_g1~~TRINITY_DN3964_c0_g1_i1.p2  ORF type:complete len:187 (-),score=29.41 TRINITY_DN3964_c0_g1_i1:128-688(-)